jgi:LacI family transcriptional regulator
MVYYGEFTTNSGRERAASMIDSFSPLDLPTAIFCGNDAIAFGCMEALAERGIKVPDDISLVGFDDSLVARMTYPPLTTVRQPLTTMGEHAVELLLAMLDSAYQPSCDEAIPGLTGTAAEAKPSHVIYPTNLVNRASTSMPR